MTSTPESKTSPGPEALRAFLRTHVEEEYGHFFGITTPRWLDEITDAWLDDDRNSAWRYQELEQLVGHPLERGATILDMAAGCGTFLFLGLKRGLDVWGVEPEAWKREFNRLKAEVYGYPADWTERVLDAVGEHLPFPNRHFDFVSSYQTLEHVQDPARCLAEMVRVTKPGGAIHIRCPDYRGTFEGHYRLPWLPLFPRPMARLYLRAAGRSLVGLRTIEYVTKPFLIRAARRALREQHAVGSVLDVDRASFASALRKRNWPLFPGLFFLYRGKGYLRRLFRAETTVNLFLRVGGHSS